MYKKAADFEIHFHPGSGEWAEVFPAVHRRDTGELVAGPYFYGPGEITIKNDPSGRGALIQRPDDTYYSGFLPLIPA